MSLEGPGFFLLSPGPFPGLNEEHMNRYLLEYQGKTYHVESCDSCPARDGHVCKARNVRLRRRRAESGPFPKGPCLVHEEGKAPVPAVLYGPVVIKKSSTRFKGGLACSWCGNRINPVKMVVVINDTRPGRVYCRFACLEQDLRTSHI